MDEYPCDIHDILEQSIKHNDAISAEGYAKYIASIRPTARLRLLEKWWEEAEKRIAKLEKDLQQQLMKSLVQGLR
jgi:hypothetical protein